jgi:hypothetical protein
MLLAVSALALVPTNAMAKFVQRPPAGVETVATVGSVILERFQALDAGSAKAITIGRDLKVGLGMQGKIRLRKGSAFMVERTDPLTICSVADNAYSDFLGLGGRACLYDTDNDGKFDRVDSPGTVFTSRHLKEPVAPSYVDVPTLSGGSDVMQSLTYLGSAAGVLRLSYREFAGDLARPAFTEELTFSLNHTFPQTIKWRDTSITLLGISSDGLRYRIEPNDNP